jgi:hypothetical protein
MPFTYILSKVHFDMTINESIICQIECQKDSHGVFLDNADFCDINRIKLKLSRANENGSNLNASYIHSMKWRWFPIGIVKYLF